MTCIRVRWLTVFALVALPAWAQTPAPSSVPQPVPTQVLVGPTGSSTEVSMDQIRQRLVLTAAQEPLWNALQSRVDAWVGLLFRERPVLPAEDSPAPRQIAQLVDQAQNRLASLEEIERATKVLYALLTPDQQKMFNAQWLLAFPQTIGRGTPPIRDSAPRSEGTPPRMRRGGMGGGFGGGFGR